MCVDRWWQTIDNLTIWRFDKWTICRWFYLGNGIERIRIVYAIDKNTLLNCRFLTWMLQHVVVVVCFRLLYIKYKHFFLCHCFCWFFIGVDCGLGHRNNFNIDVWPFCKNQQKKILHFLMLLGQHFPLRNCALLMEFLVKLTDAIFADTLFCTYNKKKPA